MGKSEQQPFNSQAFEEYVNSLEDAKSSTVIEAGSSSEVNSSIDAERVKQERTDGSLAKTEQRVGDLLDQLLGHNCQDLDGNRALKTPQESFHKKSVKSRNLLSPCMPKDHRNSSNASPGNFPKCRSIYSDVLNAYKSAKSLSPITPSTSCSAASPVSSNSPLPFTAASPVSSNSPLPFTAASPVSSQTLLPVTSSIRKHLSLLSRASTDLFSAQEILTGSSSLIPQNVWQPDNDESINLDAEFEDADSKPLISFVHQSVPISLQCSEVNIPATSLEQPLDNECVMGTEQHSEANHIPEDGSQEDTKNKSKARSRSQQHRCKTHVQPHMHKSDRCVCRRSLPDGVRRTTRIRTRPLEFWRGEKLLFGRVDSSLVTVIGKKYKSSEDETDFKVESYVSDKYKGLVKKAASH